MSLVVAGAVVGGLMAVSGTLVAIRRLRRARQRRVVAAAPVAGLVARGFAANLGDVVSLAGIELWLEDGWLVSEQEPVAALLFASEGVLALLPQPSESCVLLHPISLPVPVPPPTSLEYQGVRFERTRRRPVLVEAQGSLAAPLEHALLAEYEAGGGAVVWVLADSAHHEAWLGHRHLAKDLERWGPVNTDGRERDARWRRGLGKEPSGDERNWSSRLRR